MAGVRAHLLHSRVVDGRSAKEKKEKKKVSLERLC